MYVFDFDKTLTNQDTLFGFYEFVAGEKRYFRFKKLLLILAAVFYKCKILNNDQLKSLGILFFLKGYGRKNLVLAAEGYANTVKLNQLYHEVYSKIPRDQKIVISASPTIYLERIFPGQRVVGTELSFAGDVIKGLKVNMFGKAKSNFLKSTGVGEFDVLYTDSFADKPLMSMARRTFLVRNGEILKDLEAK